MTAPKANSVDNEGTEQSRGKSDEPRNSTAVCQLPVRGNLHFAADLSRAAVLQANRSAHYAAASKSVRTA